MKYVVSILTGIVVMLLIWHWGLVIRITNLEKQQLRIEQEYQTVITENKQLQRINEQNIHLLTEGGWYGVFSDDLLD